nr:MAG TPA: DNA helix destabilizing protein [Caudoviricetes sp.]
MSITIGEVRFSFVSLAEAKDLSDRKNPKYATLEELREMPADEAAKYKFSVNFIVPKNATAGKTGEKVLDRMQKAVNDAVDFAVSGKGKVKLPAEYAPTLKKLWADSGEMLVVTKNKLKTVVRDGDTDDRSTDKEYLAGAINFTADQYAVRRKTVTPVKTLAPGAGVPVEIDPSEVYSGCYGYAVVTPYIYEYEGTFGLKFFVESVLKTRDGERLDGTVSAQAAYGDILEAYADDASAAFGEVTEGGSEDTEAIFG